MPLVELDQETALWFRDHGLETGVVIQAGVDAGAVRSVQGRVPGKGVRTFVDATTFSDELAGFLGQVRTGARSIAVPPARGRLRPWVRRTLGQPSILRLAELLCRRPEHFVKLARRTPFWPSQIPEEIVWLMKLVAALRPRRLLEIGTATGGTLYLLARAAGPDARFATIDLEQRYDPKVLRSFAHGRQQIELIVGSSAAENTMARVRTIFPDGLDLLFIDGDHSYEGIRQDFEHYAPLVRPNGVVVFHDIVDDNITRFGIATGSRADGVPRLWRELKSTYASQESWSRDYHWTHGDRIDRIDDGRFGTTTYDHHTRGRLIAEQHEGTALHRAMDEVGNVYRTADRTDRRFVRGGIIRNDGEVTFSFDLLGNMVERTLPDGTAWKYGWDGAGMLRQVVRPDGVTVSFAYDALGRRVSKIVGEVETRWVWDRSPRSHRAHMKNTWRHSGRPQTMKRSESTSRAPTLGNWTRPPGRATNYLVEPRPSDRHEGLGGTSSGSLLPPGVGAPGYPGPVSRATFRSPCRRLPVQIYADRDDRQQGELGGHGPAPWRRPSMPSPDRVPAMRSTTSRSRFPHSSLIPHEGRKKCRVPHGTRRFHCSGGKI